MSYRRGVLKVIVLHLLCVSSDIYMLRNANAGFPALVLHAGDAVAHFGGVESCLAENTNEHNL